MDRTVLTYLDTTHEVPTNPTSLKRLLTLAGTVILGLFFLLRSPLQAQVATGDILGTISDTSGAVIVNATVRLENSGTHEVRTAVTKGNGEYVFSALQPGTYVVTVASEMFKTFSAKDIVVLASDRVRIDARLQAGAQDEQVEVTATPSALQTDSTTVGSTITEKTLLDAPLNGRNYIALVQLQAGVNPGSTTSFASGQNLGDRRLSSSISANGQQEFFNNNLVDGLDNNGRTTGAVLLRPSVEAIAEVRTDINLYNAEVGRTGGAVVNVITKSGANQVHGSAYEFFRNDITDARNFFATKAVLSHKSELRQNQFGGSLSGPILRDRTFFFVDYEGFRGVDGNNSVFLSSVPSAAEQATPGYLGDLVNPYLSTPVSSIPTAAIDPTALGYFKLFPLPNLPGTANNYLSNPSATLFSNVGDLRVDHHFSAADTFFARYSYNRTNAFNPSAFPSVGGVVPSGLLRGAGFNTISVHNGQLSYTHIFTPSLLMLLKAGYGYYDSAAVGLNDGQSLNDNAPYRIPNSNECAYCSGLALISVAGFSPLGDSAGPPAYVVEHNTQFAGSVTYTHGRQTLTMGGSLIRRNFVLNSNPFPKGYINFTTTAVAPTLANPAGTYQPSLQNFFLGAPYVFTRLLNIRQQYDRTWEPSGFFQDDWRVTDHLTLNMGLRYDVFTQPNEKNGNFSNFNLTSLSIVQSATGGIQNNYRDLSPRFGFDAGIGKERVLRGGFGLTFFPGYSNSQLVLVNPPISFSTGNVLSTTPLSTTGVYPVAVQSTATANLSGSLISRSPHSPDSYMEQFNLLFQQDYRGTVLTVGYVGELGRHLVDEVPNADVPAPTGPYPGNIPTAAPLLLYASQLPKVTTINYYGSFGASSYNSLQLSLERRVARGLTANFNYTYAHNLDDLIEIFDGDLNTTYGFGDLPNQIGTYDYGNSPLDLRKRFAGFFSYDLPFGNSGSRLRKTALGGFRFNGLGFWQTGSAFTITSAAAQASGLATINLPTITIDRPNIVGTATKTGAVGAGTTFFNIAAFGRQPFGTAGNEKRNQLFGPDLRRGDLSLFKTISIREQVRMELRAECFNFTNTPNFAKPASTILAYSPTNAAGLNVASGAGGFGSVSSTLAGYSGRQFQFAARLSF